MPLLAQSLSENRRTLALASPIIAGYVGQMLMGWADTIMVGRVGVVPLAACAFANTVLAVPLVFGFAVLSSVSVRASLAFGGGRARMPGEALRAGLVIGGILGICVVGAIHAALPLLPWLGQGPEINAACKNFLILCAWSSVPVFVTTATKNFCEALSRPWVPFWIVIAGVSAECRPELDFNLRKSRGPRDGSRRRRGGNVACAHCCGRGDCRLHASRPCAEGKPARRLAGKPVCSRKSGACLQSAFPRAACTLRR